MNKRVRQKEKEREREREREIEGMRKKEIIKVRKFHNFIYMTLDIHHII